MGTVSKIPAGFSTVTPYLVIKGASEAIEFYKKAFAATELFRLEMPGGRIAHAEIKIGNATLMLSDEYPEMHAVGPLSLGGTPIGLHLYVEDVDAWAKRAVEAGAKVERPVEDQFYGDRTGTLMDPFGFRWSISTHIEDVSHEEMSARMKKMMGG